MGWLLKHASLTDGQRRTHVHVTKHACAHRQPYYRQSTTYHARPAVAQVIVNCIRCSVRCLEKMVVSLSLYSSYPFYMVAEP